MSLLDNYWVLPMPPEYRPPASGPQLDGFCVVCGEHVPKTDPESSPCPQRYLIPHGEVLPFVRTELEKIPHHDDGKVSVRELRAAARRGRVAWAKSKGDDMFEKDLEATSWNDNEWPTIFYEIAEVTEDVTAEDVRDAVLAALMACPDNAPFEERQQAYRSLLRYIVEDYANDIGASIDTACDALVGAAQASEPIKEEIIRRRRATT